MSNQQQKHIRSFLYMNVPILYSIYSQVFEGITDRITEERIIQAITSNTEGIPLTPSRNETQSSDASRRIESGILHDHMYSRLEAELGTSLPNVSDLGRDALASTLMDSPLIKIIGRSEIEDYERLRAFIKMFNQLGQMIAYASKSSHPDHKNKVLDLMEKLLNPANSGHKKQIQAELDKLANTFREAREAGLLQDPNLMDNLALFAEVFNTNGYEVVITPSDGSIRYRGVLDRNWLRILPQLISSMYGGQSEAHWTMVGIVTHVQGTYTPHEQLPMVGGSDNPMMLDAYRNMFRSARTFERMFLESDNGFEIIVSPIAIYRDFVINKE